MIIWWWWYGVRMGKEGGKKVEGRAQEEVGWGFPAALHRQTLPHTKDATRRRPYSPLCPRHTPARYLVATLPVPRSDDIRCGHIIVL